MALMVCLLYLQANFSSLWLWEWHPGFFAGWSCVVLLSLFSEFHVLIFKSATETQSWHTSYLSQPCHLSVHF